MSTRSIGSGYKIIRDKDGKTKVILDRKAQLAKLNLSKRLQVQGAGNSKVRVARGKKRNAEGA